MVDTTLLTRTLLKIVLYIAIGVAARKARVLDDTAVKRISGINMNITMPALLLATGMEVQELSAAQIGMGLLCGFVWQLILVGIGLLVVRFICRNRADRGAYAFMIAFGNTGILGFPLIEPLFGSIGLGYAATINTTFNILVFTVGMILISGQKLSWRAVVHNLANPSGVMCLVVPFMLLIHVDYPAFLQEGVSTLGSMTLPLLMFTVGANLADLKWDGVFKDIRLYVVLLLRLLVLCFVLAPLIRILVPDVTLQNVLIVLTAVPVAGLSTMLNILYGTHAKESSTAVLFSTVLCLLTIPFVVRMLIA